MSENFNVWVRGVDAHEEMPPIGVKVLTVSLLIYSENRRYIRWWYLESEREEWEKASELMAKMP